MIKHDKEHRKIFKWLNQHVPLTNADVTPSDEGLKVAKVTIFKMKVGAINALSGAVKESDSIVVFKPVLDSDYYHFVLRPRPKRLASKKN